MTTTTKIVADDVKKMTDHELFNSACAIFRAGNASAKARRLAQARLRDMGFRWFVGIGIEEDGAEYATFGIFVSTGGVSSVFDNLARYGSGSTLNEAIHALGNGDARTGWAIFNS